MTLRARALSFSLLALSMAAGCNLQRIAADQTAEVAEAGSLGISGFWDYQIFGQAVPGAIVQGEALLRVSPGNEKLLIGLARTYVSYAFGWLQDDWELADERGEFERADELEKRVMLLYQRAARVAMRVARMHDDDGQLDEKIATHKVEILRSYVRRVYTDQDDVAGLYWAGLAWGSVMANSGGDLNVLADAPLARAMLERSVELDPSYADGGGLGVLGTVEASFPELFGGDLNKARDYYERALEVSERRNHLVLLSYAKTYAVAKQDRELFLKLLREILDSPDRGDEVRMSNKVARHRAERYIRRVDDWFPPPLGGDPAPARPQDR